MRIRALSLALLVVGLAAATTPAARADWLQTAPQTFSLPLTLTDWDQNTASLAGKNPFEVRQFDAASAYQGPLLPGQHVTLEAIGIRLDYEFQNTIAVRFDNPSTITVQASGYMQLSLPGVTTDLVNRPTFSNSVTETRTTGTFPQTVVETTKVTKSFSALAYDRSNLAILNAFTGTGLVDLPVTARAVSDFLVNSGNGQGTSDTAARATLSVVYFFAVPEPTSFALVGVGGVGLLVTFRTRSRRQD